MPTNNLVVGLSGELGIAVSLLLLALLALREIARVSTGPHWEALARALTVAITPVLIIFLAAVAIYLIQALQ